MTKFFFYQLSFLILFNLYIFASNYNVKNNKPSISGSDTLINDINHPYSQSEIRTLINLQAIDYIDGDITHLIILEFDNWINNKNIEGIFEQHYSVVNSNHFKTKYILKIYNINFNIEEQLSFNFSQNISYQLKVPEMIEKLELLLNDEIINYQIINDEYSSSYNTSGTYLVSFKVTNKKNEIKTINCNIQVTNNNSLKTEKSKIIILLLVFSGVIITPIIYLRKKRRKK